MKKTSIILRKIRPKSNETKYDGKTEQIEKEKKKRKAEISLFFLTLHNVRTFNTDHYNT